MYLAVSSVLGGVALIYGLYYWFLYSGFANRVDSTGALIGVRAGTFGDAFGVINALFSGLAFSGVLITILLQRKDLSDAHEQSSIQQTEFQFYNMLNLQQKVVQGFDIHINRPDKQYTLEGRDCFRDWYNKLRRAHDSSFRQELDEQGRARYAYGSVLKLHQGDLGLYFRSLYSVFRFIERAEHADKKHLGRVVRSLLSDYELVFLFYNCLSERGEKFLDFAVTHELFDNLDVELLLDIQHVRLVSLESFGSNENAIAEVGRLKREGL